MLLLFACVHFFQDIATLKQQLDELVLKVQTSTPVTPEPSEGNTVSDELVKEISGIKSRLQEFESKLESKGSGNNNENESGNGNKMTKDQVRASIFHHTTKKRVDLTRSPFCCGYFLFYLGKDLGPCEGLCSLDAFCQWGAACRSQGHREPGSNVCKDPGIQHQSTTTGGCH